MSCFSSSGGSEQRTIPSIDDDDGGDDNNNKPDELGYFKMRLTMFETVRGYMVSYRPV